MHDAHPATIGQALRGLRSGATTSVDLVRSMLQRADTSDATLGVYLARFDEAALQAALRCDQERERGIDRGPLFGIPIGVKDLLAAKEGPTTAQSLVTEPGWGLGIDAVVVDRLRRAGAIISGKTTTMEFGVGFPDPTKPFPLPRNPWNTAAWAGGSSSGSASGVAAGFFLGAIGTDSGGSIRCPAAFCGVSGLKPTYGRVPTTGTLPLSYSVDHVGPMARDCWDLAAMLGAIAGADPGDPTSAQIPVPDYVAAIDRDIVGLRVGVMRDAHFAGDEAPEVVDAFASAVACLDSLGADVREVTIPRYRDVVAAAGITLVVEAYAYHADNLRVRSNDFYASTREHLMRAASFTDADYEEAQRTRRLGKGELAALFESVDVIVTPTLTIGAPTYQRIADEGLMPVLAGRGHTNYWNIMGNPVVAVPIGFTADELPLSMQVAGAPFDEATVLRVGHAFQSATDWHLRRPT